MHLSRRVLSQAVAKSHLNHHLIAPRSSLEILGSAAKACFTLLKSPVKRDECLNLLNNGVINAPVLGVPMTLALYNDLSSPLLVDHKFEPQEFMEGVKHALDHFHSVEGQLQNQTLDNSIQQWKKFQAEYETFSTSSATDQSQNENENENESENKDVNASASANEIIQHDWMQKIQEKLENLDPNDHDWKKQANENPDSLLAQLTKMVAPHYFSHLYAVHEASAPLITLDPNPARYVSSEVSNVALLSARAQIIPPTPVSREEEEKLNDHDAQKNDDILNNIYSDIDELPVAAQVEVLYDMIVERSISGLEQGLGVSQDNSDENQNDDTEKTIKGAVVQVAVFEGWLHRSPDGSPLRWELASVRTPWEFR